MRAIIDYFVNGTISDVILGIFVGMIIISAVVYWLKQIFSKNND